MSPTSVRERVALGERIPGFGHSVYKHGDPRAVDLLAALAKAGADKRLAIEAPALFTEATGLYPNIDYALAVMMRTFGLAIGHEMALFAIARTAGWVAHGIEQLRSETLIRPRARYVGPAPAPKQPVDAGLADFAVFEFARRLHVIGLQVSRRPIWENSCAPDRRSERSRPPPPGPAAI